MAGKKKIIIAIVFLAAVAVLYWYFYFRQHGQSLFPQVPKTAAPAQSGLGNTIYNKATNPVQDKLPETTPPVPNPIQGIYKNPFQ